MIKLVDKSDFEREGEYYKTFYVAFLQGQNDSWFPFCITSSNQKGHLDTLCISKDYSSLDAMVKPLLEDLPGVKNYLVHLVYLEEIKNLVDRYGVEYVGYIGDDEEGCSCGCGCH